MKTSWYRILVLRKPKDTGILFVVWCLSSDTGFGTPKYLNTVHFDKKLHKSVNLHVLGWKNDIKAPQKLYTVLASGGQMFKKFKSFRTTWPSPQFELPSLAFDGRNCH